MKTWLGSCLEFTFWLVLNLFTLWIGSSINCVYQADDVRADDVREREREGERQGETERDREWQREMSHVLDLLN